MTQQMTPEAVESNWSKLTVEQQEWWKGFFDNAKYVKLAEYKIAKPYPYNIHMTEATRRSETKALRGMKASIEEKLWDYDGSWLAKQEAKIIAKELENKKAIMVALNNGRIE